MVSVPIEGTASAGLLNGFSAAVGGLQKDTTGVQRFSFNGSMTCRSGTLIHKYNFYTAINGTPQAKSQYAAYLDSNDTNVRNPDVISLADLDETDQVAVYVENTDGTQFCLVENAMINVEQI